MDERDRLLDRLPSDTPIENPVTIDPVPDAGPEFDEPIIRDESSAGGGAGGMSPGMAGAGTDEVESGSASAYLGSDEGRGSGTGYAGDRATLGGGGTAGRSGDPFGSTGEGLPDPDAWVDPAIGESMTDDDNRRAMLDRMGTSGDTSTSTGSAMPDATYTERAIDDQPRTDDEPAIAGGTTWAEREGEEPFPRFDAPGGSDPTTGLDTTADTGSHWTSSPEQTPDENRGAGPDPELEREATGGAVGAVGGAVVGGVVGGPPGAVIGGVVGAIGGAVVGGATEATDAPSTNPAAERSGRVEDDMDDDPATLDGPVP